MQASRFLLAELSDRDLLATVKQLAARERFATVDLIASLAEIDARRLYLGEGCASLFAYCTRVLLLSEHAAYHRIEAARAAVRFPIVLERLADGSLTLTTVTLLARHLTADNVVAVLGAARGRSKRDVERQVAALAPRPDVPSSIRKHPAPAAPSAPVAAPETPAEPASSAPLALLDAAPAPRMPDAPAPASPLRPDGEGRGPQPAPALPPAAPPAAQRPRIEPLSPDRYKVQITVSAGTLETLRRLQDLMRHSVPDGDPAVIVERALGLLLVRLERTKLAATSCPRASGRRAGSRSRYIPADVRRAVWQRDEGQCTFEGREGRCQERGFLEFHHTEPYALGGEATIERIALRCRAHNAYEAEQAFGPRPSVARETRARYGCAGYSVRTE